MRSKKSASLFFVGLFLLLVTVSNAFAGRTITSATLDGASTDTVSPSATVSAAVTVTTSGIDNNWQSTGWRIGSSGSYTCVDHSNHNSSGTNTETFNITAPGTAGTYNVSFIAYSDNSCTTGLSSAYTLTNALTVVARTAPVLSTCWIENFSDVNISENWTIIANQNYTPQVVNQKLMLTNNGSNISTGMTLSGQLPANNNYLTIEFEQNAYGGNGADGITLTLSDASVTPVAGAYGGSLGYAQKTGINGFAGGWLGFGIDEYGNYSNPTEGRILGPGFRPDAFSIRGAGSGTSGYNYITGTSTLSPGVDVTGTSTTPQPGDLYRLTIDTHNAQTWIKVERDTTGTGSSYSTIIDWTNATQAATSPQNFRLSLTGSTGGSNNYHSVDNFTLNALDCGTIGRKFSELASRFDAWDTFRSISDRNISTKIVNKPFDLNISSLNDTQTALQDFNGTVCTQIIDASTNIQLDRSCKTWNNLQSSPYTFTSAKASKDAFVKIAWKKNNLSGTFTVGSEDNSTVAGDHFAIRPASFGLSAPNAVAGTDFNITFTAPIYGAAAASADYNETAGSTFSVTYAEHIASCPLGTFNPVPNSGWAFSNGSKILTTRYSEVGIVDVNISDTAKACTARYTSVDCDDANVSDGIAFTADLLPIGLTQGQIIIKPHHFDINATLTNFGGGNFTYLSSDLNMSSTLNATLSAKNGEGNTTKNYDKGCYAKSTTLTLPHSAVPDPLSQILCYEALSGTGSTVTKSNDIVLNFGNTIFTQGAAPLRLDCNFDRDRSKPLNPFNFTFLLSDVRDFDGVTGTGTPLGSAEFVYGRIRPYDVTTNEASAPNPVEFEVYSTNSSGYVSGMPQNVLKWYRNTHHSSAAAGKVIQGGFTAGTTDSAVSTSSAPQNGIQVVTVTSSIDRTVHLDINRWLWYSPKYDYNYGTNCTQHPCFFYDYTDSAAGVSGVSSGTFQGSDFQMVPAQNITNKGVKLFR